MSTPESEFARVSPEASSLDSSGANDPRLFAAVQEYLAAIEQGKRVNRKEFLAKYPEVAAELNDCLDALAFVKSAAGELSNASPGKSPGSSRRPGRGEIDLSTAEPLGDFKLIREVGHGGMGTVYEATQLSLGRRVAVKVLPLAAGLDERHLERFHNEAQAAARLHHTNIVPVYAVGCERSVHFYAMQLIEGHSLAEIITELKALNDRGVRATIDHSSVGLSAEKTITSLGAAHSLQYCRSAVKLALQVAEALAYAHEAGIVHRDIKPANLLLDARGKLWVTDFGLAQLNVDNGLTRSGDLVGTLRYMSPEQASGRAVVMDQRTDIYSLGVTLYELLTLERAYPGKNHQELLHQIAIEQPLSMRAIDTTIPRELETIVNKAISKDPIDRYSSADAFADDLRRFLKDEPILARPPSVIDKSIKWVRRHKSLTAMTFAAVMLAAIGFSISTFLIAMEQLRTRNALTLEKTALADEQRKAIEVQEQRIRAERVGRLAREAVAVFSQIAWKEMDKPGFSEIRREMLEETLSYYRSILQDGGDSPSVSAEVAAARARVTEVLQRYVALDTLLSTSTRARLLNDITVRRDLKVSPAQVKSILTITSQPIAVQSESDNSNADAQRFAQYSAQLDHAITAAIGEQGAERLKQIFWQIQGPAAMTDPEVAKQLSLSSPQQVRIREIMTRLSFPHFRPPGQQGRDHGEDHDRDAFDFFGFDGGPPDGRPLDNGPLPGSDQVRDPGHGSEKQRPRAEALQQIVALLTEEQRDKWKLMLGKPIDVDAIRSASPEGPDHSDHGRGPDDIAPGEHLGPRESDSEF